MQVAESQEISKKKVRSHSPGSIYFVDASPEMGAKALEEKKEEIRELIKSPINTAEYDVEMSDTMTAKNQCDFDYECDKPQSCLAGICEGTTDKQCVLDNDCVIEGQCRAGQCKVEEVELLFDIK